MSILLLNETYGEVKRLMIAGSDLSANDFRLKKLVGPLIKAGESAPVFLRVAQGIEKVIEPSDREEGAKNLLELSNLVNAILYTQGQTGAPGTLSTHPVPMGYENGENIENGIVYGANLGYRTIQPLIEALTTIGSGRLEVLKEAKERGLQCDFRIIDLLVAGLDDVYYEVADVAMKILLSWGKVVLPFVYETYDVTGGKGQVLRLRLIAELENDSALVKAKLVDALDNGKEDMRLTALQEMGKFPSCEQVLIDNLKDRKGMIKEYTLRSLAAIGSDCAAQKLFEVYKSKDGCFATTAIRSCSSPLLNRLLVGEGRDLLKQNAVVELNDLVGLLFWKEDDMVFDFLKEAIYHYQDTSYDVKYVKMPKEGEVNEDYNQYKFRMAQIDLTKSLGACLNSLARPDAKDLLCQLPLFSDSALMAETFKASVHHLSPKEVYHRYAPFLKKGSKSSDGKLLIETMTKLLDSPGVQWDSRFLDVLIDIDESEMLCELLPKHHKAGMIYLTQKLHADKKKVKVKDYQILQALIRMEHPTIEGVLEDYFENICTPTSFEYTHRLQQVIDLFRAIPPEQAAQKGLAIEKMATKFDPKVSEKLVHLAHYLKDKGAAYEQGFRA